MPWNSILIFVLLLNEINISQGYNLEFLIFSQKPLPKVLDEDEMDEEEEPLDEENYSTTLIDYVTINFVSSQEIEKIKKENP